MIVFSASLWIATLVGVKNNGKLILLSAAILSAPAAVTMAEPGRQPAYHRFCAEPSVEVMIPHVYGERKTTLPVCYVAWEKTLLP